MTRKALVTGAGGFIGGHLCAYLKLQGYWVRGVDIKRHEFRKVDADEFLIRDLRNLASCIEVTRGIDEVYGLAADMGGMGFIAYNDARIMYNNTTINTNTLHAAYLNGVPRYFFSSSACVYPDVDAEHADLAETDAYPAHPDNEYGWEKLYFERVCMAYARAYGIQMRIARFHNCYGPYGTWRGGREKAPAALCRKVAEKIESTMVLAGGPAIIDVWGDGQQMRSFIYIDDLIEGVYTLMQSEYGEPLNLGSDEMVTVDCLAETTAEVAGVELAINHIPVPREQVGVRARNSDNALCKAVIGWEPKASLSHGIAVLYPWIAEQVSNSRTR